MAKPLLMLFDGNAIVHRAFHALPPLTVSKTGEIVNAVYGFALMFLKTIDELKPTQCAIAFDKKGPTFRHDMFEDYKAHRPATPDELVRQFPLVRELVDAFNIPVFELDSYEADDILGSLSRQSSEQGIDTIIVTGDADAMQLVSPKVRVLYPKPGRGFSDTIIYDEDAVLNKYGVKPSQIMDFKGLKGDPSDNIPGVPGIGDKTAVKLLQQFGSIEEIYARIDEITPPRIQKLLRENEEIALKSRELATIVLETPVTLNLKDCQLDQYDRGQVGDFFRKMEFFSLLSRLPAGEGMEVENGISVSSESLSAGNYHMVNTLESLDEMMNRLSGVKTLGFDTETTGLNTMTAELVGISLSAAPGEAYYIPVGHTGLGQVEQLPLKQVIFRLKPLLADDKVNKIAQNGKYDMTIMAENGIDVTPLTFDTMIAAHLLDEPSLGLKAMAFNKLGIEMTSITDLIGSGAKQISMALVEVARASDYACADADMTFRLAELFKPALDEQGFGKLFNEVEMPLVPVLVAMERNGVAVEKDLLREMSHRTGEQMLKAEARIYDSVGRKFNINSPQQLSVVLFEELKLPSARKTKSGYSTGAAVLEGLRGAHPIIELILEYRQLSKLKSTYIDALPAMVNPRTGRLHTSFNQTRTSTGRLSSSDPNLQNIPIRDEKSREIRRAFIAPGQNRLIAGDYSQIDLRALAHLSQDKNLLSAFRNDEDIHSVTAAKLFNVDISGVKDNMRRLAKTVNFGVIYGMSDYGLQQATELSREEASQFIKAYFEKYPGIKEYLDSTKEQVRKKGYAETLLGRRRSIAEINSPNRQVREAAERMAINMPVQGTSADIIKVAMINLYREMTERRIKSKMILQVHDELIFEIPDDELEIMSMLVPKIMTTALKLSVPLKVDIKAGKNWGEME
ncbi:DNA polymerase I [Chloroflexota bacterium]